DIFPWDDELSEDIESGPFAFSHLEQPDLFLRVRPGMEAAVSQKLKKSEITFETITANCLALPNASKMDTILELDREAVVQDLNSQRVGEFMQLARPGSQQGRIRRRIKDDQVSRGLQKDMFKGGLQEDMVKGELQEDRIRRGPSDPIRVWDCCAASGGKSIMAKDVLGDIELFVSDLRESILANLEDRFERAGLGNYERFVADLSKPPAIFLPSFNLVIADVPCTGSGTWGRTPEQLYYFDPLKIAKYAELQKQIIQTVIAQVEPGGYLLYITCSVFKKENEEQVAFLQEKFHLQMVKMELLKGYDKKADTLFAALLKKSL
ncbi:MAG TPA: hypothetical protein VGO58_17920, partial [Chitinophagaceae bacterium]|nr:hypothetical protein [Chitinophagaceae bacterium]